MPVRSRLEELSLELPETERKQLLDRIAKRVEREQDEEAIVVELRDDERARVITSEINRAGLWVRFLLWLRMLLTTRSRQEVFVDLKLRTLKTRIRSSAPGVTGFESRDLTPRVGHFLHQLYLRVLPLMPIYHTLGSDKAIRGAAYSWLIERRWAEARRQVLDFVPLQEMEDLVSQTDNVEEVSKKLASRVTEYIRAVPESLVAEAEGEAALHLTLSRLASFPFATFFGYFGYTLGDEAPTPTFVPAPAMLALDLMERLHACLSLLAEAGPDFSFAEEPVAYVMLLKAGHHPTEEPDFQKVKSELAELRGRIQELGKQAYTFQRAVPLMDLVRWFRRDPWYQLVANPPRLHLKSLYFATLKARLGAELSQHLNTIQEQVVTRRIAEVLRGRKQVELPHCKLPEDVDLRSMHLPGFSCIRSLTFLYNYLVQQFRGAMQEAAQLIGVTLLVNNRLLQNRISLSIAGLEDLEARIVLYDRSLSSDEEDGRILAHYLDTLANDPTTQKAYRSLVAQKDREARELIDKSKEYLATLRGIFDDLIERSTEGSRSLLKTLHVYRGKQQTIAQVLTARSEAIGTFLRVLDQVSRLE